MGRKKNSFKRIQSYNYWKFFKSNMKWLLGLVGFTLFILVMTTPLYLWRNLDWIYQFPPIYIFDMLITPLLMLTAMAIILRGLYCIIKQKPFIPTRR